ncbi:DNA-binding LacI/PurR family transcriptional regulator [Catenuloplanes nepalensis]|uniref:DNA-binding LacI/PurR family transcriptional regulator n=1 Tax=Catenuloplanes nepalensis TaxID=587533 RepID=A0ABT9MRT5_9ACTN|nr:LacI family DNA-binding transcriptional regulator [Catenuloplanes nepalensis]MDP9794150.1 DNA-binding LacI/PurR family transcriptional regulator [Catenuloplanes nepalensis]
MVLPRSAARGGPTIYDVARHAGVSHQTVSRMLKGERVKPPTRVRVETAIAELGYKPNPTARALATNTSKRIGAFVYELHEMGPSQIVQGAADEARRAGYVLDTVALDPRDDAAITHAIELLGQQQLAGVLALAPTLRMAAALDATDFQIPIVVDTEPLYDGTPATESLNVVGARLALDHLHGLGHRRIAHIAGPAEWISAFNRSAAYDRFVVEHGLPRITTVSDGWSPADGYQAALRLPPDSGVTALFVANDQMALGVLRALWERGVRVPDDISVVGFDDIAEAGYTIPPLSTVRLLFPAQGRHLVDRLLEQIEGRTPSGVDTDMGVSFVARASSR